MSERQGAVPGNDRVAELLDMQGAGERALDEDIAAVRRIAPAGEQAEPAHAVKRPRDRRLGDAELPGEAADRVRRRLEIDGEKDRHLPRRQIGRIVAHQIEGDIVPELEGLTGTKFGRHTRDTRDRFGAELSKAGRSAEGKRES